MSNTDCIIKFIIAAILGVLYFTGPLTGTLGIVQLVLASVFFRPAPYDGRRQNQYSSGQRKFQAS